MLYRISGTGFKFCAHFLVLSIIGNYLVVRRLNGLFARIAVFRDRRMCLLSDIVEGLKSLKYLSWEDIFYRKVMKLREDELRLSTRYLHLDGVLTVFWNVINYVLLYAYILYSDAGQNAVNGTNIYSVIIIFSQLVYPIGVLPFSVSEVLKCRNHLRKLAKLMSAKDIDNTLYRNYQQPAPRPGEAGDGAASRSPAVSLSNIELSYPVRENAGTSADFSSPAFRLRVRDLSFPKGSITFVVGKVGSGKTLLLNGIANLAAKQVLSPGGAASPGIVVRGRLGLVTQNHWLQNLSIRENILFFDKWD